MRIIPRNGLIVANGREESIQRVLARGCWTPVERVGVANGWEGKVLADSGISIRFKGDPQGLLHWDLLGEHNLMNGLAALAAARHAGVPVNVGIDALRQFKNVKRRMEVRGVRNGITVYDDFAHHPTAIRTTLDGLRSKVKGARIIAVLEPRSNTMKMGVWKDSLADSLAPADQVFCYNAHLGWDARDALGPLGKKAQVYNDLDQLTAAITTTAQPGDHVLVMSNGAFGGLHDRLLVAMDRVAASLHDSAGG